MPDEDPDLGPDWDENSSGLEANLTEILTDIYRESQLRLTPSIKATKGWHRVLLRGLAVPDQRFVAAFRGENGLRNVGVRVDGHMGVPPGHVAAELARFETKLQQLVAETDRYLPPGTLSNNDELAAVLDLCAWAHAEWVRIHPFANGNGRIARLWANSLALRYGLPPFVRLRPRPGFGYAEAGAHAMQGDWQSTAVVFGRLLEAELRRKTL